MIKKINLLIVSMIFILIFNLSFIKTVKAEDINLTPILGTSQSTKEQMINYFMINNSERSYEYISNFVNLVWQEASYEGVRADVAFAQILVETDYLRFTGVVKEEQNNFTGLATFAEVQPPVVGLSFEDIRMGIKASIQQLKVFASVNGCKKSIINPFAYYVEWGSAEYVEWLEDENNPTGIGYRYTPGYSDSIIQIINDFKTTTTS